MNKQAQFEVALRELMTERMMTIPWHHTNSGIEIQREHVWKYETLFKMIDMEDQRHNYLVGYDTLGFFTHLMLGLTPEVTYHSAVNMYEHASSPKRTWISDIVHLPPKSPELDEKYDYIVVPSYFHNCEQDKARMLLSYLKNLLKPDGSIVMSCSIAGVGFEIWSSAFHDIGLSQLSTVTEPTELRGTLGRFFVVVKLGATK